MFHALVLEKEGDAAVARLRELDESALPPGDVTVAVEYSTLNYKDGLALSPSGGGIVRSWPHVAGIDFAGTVEASEDARYRAGDKVVLTGWRVGEVHWGGYSQKARVRADWLVPLPLGLTTRAAMAVGTAGFTAMLAVMVAPTVGINPFDPMWIATLVGIVTLSSAGVAGVGGGATFAALIVLPAMGLPVTLVALLISVEPLIDMGRTALNVSGSMTAGTVTSQLMKQTDKAIMDSEDETELAHR